MTVRYFSCQTCLKRLESMSSNSYKHLMQHLPLDDRVEKANLKAHATSDALVIEFELLQQQNLA